MECMLIYGTGICVCVHANFDMRTFEFASDLLSCWTDSSLQHTAVSGSLTSPWAAIASTAHMHKWLQHLGRFNSVCHCCRMFGSFLCKQLFLSFRLSAIPSWTRPTPPSWRYMLVLPQICILISDYTCVRTCHKSYLCYNIHVFL